MGETVKRSQYLNYELLESYQLNCVERSILQIITTRPHYYLDKLQTIGNLINKSRRTVQRAINTLLQKGLIIRKYTYYKKLILKVVSLEQQQSIKKGGLLKQLFKFNIKKKQKSKIDDASPVSHSRDASPVSHSNKKSNLKKSILNTSLNFIENNTLKPIKNFVSLEQRKKNQLEQYAKYLKSSVTT